MNSKQLGPNAKIRAVHEAGHAVVAAYLGVPVDRARLRSYGMIVRDGDLSGGSVTYLPSETPMIAERAVVSAAARVAVDELIRPGAQPELAYSDDDDYLKEIAGELGITDFQQWHRSVMESAREIVSMEHVRAAIRRVASDLQAAPLEDGLTGEHVREVLRACEMAKPR